ncbi:copper amine oxidase N-terminal domain-containing protein [Paenibacillus sp. HWE-109]|uniref:stalk domain-containing protein n=1 Tax=Paenibacillus sp. HWE-109 TaxID=1306526 RepID=UPI001EDD6EA7|nr:stalk domain-containing protein [Paenibacillus sp. HWE-109]UKS27353.1 copper amine oxidase N-terminal domain-containing protein [Paenibacillus sp. HWE-109]
MKKFIIGVVVGSILSLSSVVVASDSVQAYLFEVYFTINGRNTAIEKDYSVLNYNGSTYVPVRFIAEQLGASVDYNAINKEIAINQFSSNMKILTDSNYPNVRYSLLDLYLDGGYTGSYGLLSVDKIKESTITEHEIDFSLSFYDANEKLIGTALGSQLPSSSDYKQTITTGEIKVVHAGGVGDFSNYSSVKFNVTKYK